MFNYPNKITITDGPTRTTLPMQYGEPVNSPAWEKKKKRKKLLEMTMAESGKGWKELDWYRQNEKILPKGNL